MRHQHTLAGIGFFIVFLGTGLWMRLMFPDAYQGDTGMRLMFRSAHIYILLSALVNLVAGTAREVAATRWAALLGSLGSWMLLLAPALFTAAFFLEPAPDSVERPYVKWGCFWTLGASLAFVAARLGFSKAS